jgi:hypothetical protein
MILPTAQRIREALVYLTTRPKPSLADHCRKRLGCRFIQEHFSDLPDYTVFDIAFLSNEKRRQLLSAGIVDILDVPDDFELSRNQARQVRAARTGAVEIDIATIARRVAKWEYPLHFLDYETFAYAIPQFDGIRPFQQMCFQYSLHTIAEPGAEPVHASFLSHGHDDPPRAMTEHLRNAMSGGIGTVFVWYESFEKRRNDEMAAMFPEFAEFFAEVNRKTFDLMKIFSDRLYNHPGFKGRSSIKKVLPIVVPSLSYADLAISDGMTASISWYHAARGRFDDDECAQLFEHLNAYCHLDTLAMVEIFNVLTGLVSENQDGVA